MSLPRSLFAASLSAWWCCPDCDTVKAICPGCAEPLPIKRPANHPPALPLHWAFKCPDPYCGAALALTVCGYRPNPTGDAPAHRSPLSDPLPVAERPRPNLRPRVPSPPRPQRQTRTTTPAAAAAAARLADFRRTFPADRTPRPKRPAPPPKPAPCPADAIRYRLAVWSSAGWLPDEVEPSSIAAAHCRVFGKPAPRDPEKRTARAYSQRELGMALGELGMAFERDPLAKAWERALQLIELPSTRMLLSQQARLRELLPVPGSPGLLRAVVGVDGHWLEMAQNRSLLITRALAKALGQPVSLVLEVLP